MSIELTVLNPDGSPFSESALLELLGDGKVVGDATVDSAGIARFNIDSSGISKLAVRVSAKDPVK